MLLPLSRDQVPQGVKLVEATLTSVAVVLVPVLFRQIFAIYPLEIIRALQKEQLSNIPGKPFEVGATIGEIQSAQSRSGAPYTVILKMTGMPSSAGRRQN
jgi:hypothetical protein